MENALKYALPTALTWAVIGLLAGLNLDKGWLWVLAFVVFGFLVSFVTVIIAQWIISKINM